MTTKTATTNKGTWTTRKQKQQEKGIGLISGITLPYQSSSSLKKKKRKFFDTSYR